MTTAGLPLEHTYADQLAELCVAWQPAVVPAPRLLVLNDPLADELGLDPEWLRSPEGVAALVGTVVPEGARPVAQAYSGHQFGNLNPRLGDGRALLLGELVVDGRRIDVHLKGSGRTPFARGGDGKAAVGPMLREFVIGEAMHALGIPTTRALAVIATGEQVVRDTVLPGAVLVRTAASHLRVGTFQYAAMTQHPDVLRRLATHAISRHHPGAADDDQPYLALFDAVLEAQVRLVASWMAVGFVHGVMNTDNTTISGETIDYGPCAFIDAYDPATVYSSIDSGGRYAFGNQPGITQWNLARLAEAMLPLFDEDPDRAVPMATEVLNTFPERFLAHWDAVMTAKLGIEQAAPGDRALVDELLPLLQAGQVDFTTFFRALADERRGDPTRLDTLVGDRDGFGPWLGRWRARLAGQHRSATDTAVAMDAVNPAYVARNHLVEEALAAAVTGDLVPVERLVQVLRRPSERRDGDERYEEPAPIEFGPYRTFCGT